MALHYRIGWTWNIGIQFDKDGEVRMTGTGKSSEFQRNAELIRREVKTLLPAYPTPVRQLMLGTTLLIFAYVYFFTCLVLFFQTASGLNSVRNSKLDFDVSLSPAREQLPQLVANALKSTDISQKLNVLLQKEIVGYVSNEYAIASYRRWLIYYGTATSILGLILIYRKFMRSCYPLIFFALGRQVPNLVAMEKRRDFWNLAVIIGFIVNVVAGFVLPIFV